MLYDSCFILVAASLYVDTGNPYKDSPLEVAELTISKTSHGSPLHTKGIISEVMEVYL